MAEAAKSPSPFIPPPNEPLYGGYTRFELELEVPLLPLPSPPRPTNLGFPVRNPPLLPLYLNHLASLKLLQSPEFIAYLKYLQYWTRPEYIKYLSYPGSTLKALELLQEERFRTDILSPEVVGLLVREGVESSTGYMSGEKD
ncbi:hypothetical protein ABVK25_003560 [Lepraria finkii]|uniref:Mediator of RNA polymerase II transcription subunit 31 n=1 Tax=Lepraria finkii TaxID=1340010 RepID=A0ABR4BDJ5_9LECA